MTVVRKISTEVLLVGASLFLGASMPAHLSRQEAQQPTPDDSRANQRDQDKTSPTSDQQNMNRADRDIAKEIRVAIHSENPDLLMRTTSRSSPRVARST
jgi:hypothetical protein